MNIRLNYNDQTVNTFNKGLIEHRLFRVVWNESFEIDKLIPTAPIHFTCMTADGSKIVGESPEMILGDLKTGTYEKDVPLIDGNKKEVGYVTFGMNVTENADGERMPIIEQKPPQSEEQRVYKHKMREYRRAMRIRSIEKKKSEKPPNFAKIEVISGDFAENKINPYVTFTYADAPYATSSFEQTGLQHKWDQSFEMRPIAESNQV